jgi:signal transduction histidine kinase
MARQPNAAGASFVEENHMTQPTLAQAKTLLEDLIHSAETGAIIPIRLPGQLNAIRDLLDQVQQESEAEAAKAAAALAAAASAAVPADQAEFLTEQAKFVSHAIHELRTPMTSIRGYSDMLRSMGPLNEMQQQFVETIRTNSRRMEGLLTDVSDTSKIKAGTLRLNPKMDMFKNVAMMVEKQAQPVADQLNRKLTFDIPQGLPILNVDGELLAKALYKLVENGLRYSGDGGAVTVTGSADGSTLVIEVKDNGIGMTPEDLAKLGTIYFRADNETVLSHKGSGLGVPVAYGIVRALGGTVAVSSEAGAGTTFTIKLPGIS